ncbi:MAG: hypothetical protein DME24_12465 [Verrucomicrobia bacterium]|nr:MAG: hypothetical protein DME24_12465 [Verrucomicrobiota bacterium]
MALIRGYSCFWFHDFSNRRVKSFRVFCVVHGFQLNREGRDALSYLLRSVRSLAADKSVSIGVHPWLRENVSGESNDEAA